MNYEKNLAELNRQIECEKRKLSELLRTRRELKIAEINKGKKPMTRGRPKISESVLVRAVKLAETKTFRDVALKLNISVTSLYRYGISRKVLNGEAKWKNNYPPRKK